VYAWPTTGSEAESAFVAWSRIVPMLVRLRSIEPASVPVAPVVETVTVHVAEGGRSRE